MTKAERTVLVAMAELLLMMEPRGYVEGTDIGRARAKLERSLMSVTAEWMMGRVTEAPEAAGQIAQMIREITSKFSVTGKVGHGTD